MLILYFIGVIVGMFIPIQTSVNSRLSLYTKSPFYTSFISFSVGTICLIVLNIFINPDVFSLHFFSNQTFNYTWFVGGLLGVGYLTGNLLLLPKLGATLTVIATVAGQIIMGVIIDTFGLFGATVHEFNLIKAIGVLLLIVGIITMNQINKCNLLLTNQKHLIFWLLLGFTFGFFPPIQTTINSLLASHTHSPAFASLVSFTIGSITLLILTAIFNRSLKLKTSHLKFGKLKPIYFTGGILGMAFVTSNIILMPHLGAALTTLIGMFGQILMGILIDHFALFGSPKIAMTSRKTIGLLCILTGIILLRLF
ncbi:TPA: DMT family transporter [Staphylococcus aureus]|uniref:DMT family transporter n=1 Tax=Staphylococcus aureus TaxID=1280 RepID=UPI001C1EAA31|nr:DMT family transporter [Staphylococcus aureus]MBU6885728.1 DMT family transporter [Staphylococcus aureus]MBU6898971.1 DMT family transporter [Staphylococcus aureus]HCX2121686.1 DMT family transporter [Staphylococcus aureus]HDH4187910.1 DMT family transporter [Staphylococcus aureus]HDI5068423.1 DMT family transporter [Staphylococcus aureus]